MSVYRVRRLEWEEIQSPYVFEVWCASSALWDGVDAEYWVQRRTARSGCEWGTHYDDEVHPCNSLAHGQELAEQHWRERILPMLEPVDMDDPEHMLRVALDRLMDEGDERAEFLNSIVSRAGKYTNWQQATWSDTPFQ